jgi:hypothetical protein
MVILEEKYISDGYVKFQSQYFFETGKPNLHIKVMHMDFYKLIMSPNTKNHKVLYFIGRTEWPHESTNEK